MSKLSDSVKVHLANSVTLYMKASAFHWNTVGPRFGMLHELFGKVYEASQSSIDMSGEIIRQLGEFPPSTLAQVLELTEIAEQKRVPVEDGMIKELLVDMDIMIASALRMFDEATPAREQGIANYAADQQACYEKLRWFLRSTTAL